MLLLNAIMILLLSGHYFTQDDTNITPNYCSRMGFTLWSNLTLTCSRNCSPQAESDLDIWHFQPGENLLLIQLNLHNCSFNYSIISDNQLIINDFEDDAGVTLSLSNNNTEDSCNAGEVIEYSLTIENARRSIDGLVVTCGANITENDETTYWRTSNSTVLYLKSQITTYATSKITVFPGSSTTISCTRQHFPDREVYNRWRLQRPSKDYVDLIERSGQADQFFEDTGVTLELNTSSNTCKYDEFVNYTLTIGNINQNVDGMLIKCGVRTISGTANHDEWYADHSVELVLHNTTELEATIVDTMAQLEECNVENVAIRENITELQEKCKNEQDTFKVATSKKLEDCKNEKDNTTKLVNATTAQLDKCSAEKGIIGGTLGAILLALFAAVIVVLIIIILYQQQRINRVHSQQQQIECVIIPN